MSSKFNKDKAFAQQRKKNLPKGRDMPYFEIRQIIMGDMEVYTDLTFVDVSTLPFELRPANSIRLDSQGDVVQGVLECYADTDVADAYSAGVPMQRACLKVNLPKEQRMTGCQMVTFRNHNGKYAKYDMISIFSLRPPELLGVFRNPVDYFRHCHIDEEQGLNEEAARSMSSNDLHKCPWVDCFGRRVFIHKLALKEVAAMARTNLAEFESLNEDTDRNEFFYPDE